MSSTKSCALAAGLALAALLAGCASPPPVTGARLDAPTALDQYRITVQEIPDRIGLTVREGGLSAAQRDALTAFAGRWRDAGGGVIALQTPSDAPDPDAAKAYADNAAAALGGMGVPYENIRVTPYKAGAGARPVVLAAFTRTQAVAPDCKSVKWENLTATNSNASMRRFGCTNNANLAAMIADPRDLVGETPLAPADNTRRQVVIGKYRDGKITSSERDDQASGSVSTAVKP